jgi:hypothetical protein
MRASLFAVLLALLFIGLPLSWIIFNFLIGLVLSVAR